MSWRAVGLLLYCIIAAVVGIASTAIVQAMVDEVNHKRPPADRISPYGWYPGKLTTVVDLYRQSYPNGRRHIQLAVLVAVGVLGFVVAVVSLLVPS